MVCVADCLILEYVARGAAVARIWKEKMVILLGEAVGLGVPLTFLDLGSSFSPTKAPIPHSLPTLPVLLLPFLRKSILQIIYYTTCVVVGKVLVRCDISSEHKSGYGRQ